MMLWQAKQTPAQKLLAIVYKIQPKLLAIDNHQAWTNLGCWQENEQNYLKAASLLAQKMGQSLQLTQQDRLLDIGCGYGATVELWHSIFDVKHIGALELQQKCCEYLKQKNWMYLEDIYHQSCFDVKPVHCQNSYDVIVSVDATYHYGLKDYLAALDEWLAPSGRVGFHLLIKSEQWQSTHKNLQSIISKKLKWAKVNAAELLDQDEVIQLMQQQGYEQIEIKDLTTVVLQGFAAYIQQKKWSTREKFSIGFFKIYFTAKLCQALADSHIIQYVQITAKKK